MYGWRGRIGLLVPAINTTMETSLWRMVPEGVSVHTARLPTNRSATIETLQQMEEDAKVMATHVAQAEPDVIVYSCTSGSFVGGVDGDARIRRDVQAITGIPCITAAQSMAESLQAGGAKVVDMVTPYVEVTNQRLVAFLAGHGIRVNSLATFDMLDQFDHAKIEPEDIYRKARETMTGEADAVFIACMQLRTMEIIDMLERDIGKPALSAVQATAWNAFRKLGIDPRLEKAGSLMRGLSGVRGSERRAA